MSVDGKTWLFSRIIGNTSVRARFIREYAELGINRRAVDAYVARVGEFREKLLLLMYITGG